MSKWVNGKLDLKCSLDVLKRALINVMPEWKDYLLVDPSGKLELFGYMGAKETNHTFNLVIPGQFTGAKLGKLAPGRGLHNDWGFRQDSDGKWICQKAEFGLKQAETLETKILTEVATMRMKAVAQLRGDRIVSEKQTDETKEIIIECDMSKARTLMKA